MGSGGRASACHHSRVFPALRPLACFLLAAVLLLGCASREGRFDKVLVFGKTSDAVKLDPAEVNEGESASVTQNIFDTLVRYKSVTTSVEPDLATSWTVSPDGKVYTFKLRPQVHFHDGTPCDAAAVKYTFDRQMDPKHPGHTGSYEYWMNFFQAVVKGVAGTPPLAPSAPTEQALASRLSALSARRLVDHHLPGPRHHRDRAGLQLAG